MELATCNHKEENLGTFEGQILVACTICGQSRRYKKGDNFSVVITSIGRIGEAIVMPPAGVKFDGISPEDYRLIAVGWDMLQQKEKSANGR